MSFSKEQTQAIQHRDGPAMILAGPGSGKTTVITQRILHLLRSGIPADSILVITFTKAAALEMEKRFQRLWKDSGLQSSGSVTFGTFHSIFFSILRQHYHLSSQNIITSRDQKMILQSLVEDENIDASYDMEFFRLLIGEISQCKALNNMGSTYTSSLIDSVKFHRILHRYQEIMASRRLLDFDDMLLHCHKLFLADPAERKRWQDHYHYILVDEFQDISPVQYEITKILASPENNLFIVGDDDQSIYHFRGADPEIMLNFGQDYPDSVRIHLSNNYRSSPEIVRLAGNVIRHNKKRFSKDIHPMSTLPGTTFCYRSPDLPNQYRILIDNIRNELEKGILPDQIAVLYRTQNLIRPLLTEFQLQKIPYVLKEHVSNLYEHFIAKDLLSYLRLSMGQGTRSDLLRIINRPVRYIQRSAITKETLSLQELFQYYDHKPGIQQNIKTLLRDLALLKTLPTSAAILYIEKKIGYLSFLHDYAKDHHICMESFHDILKELESSSLRFPDKKDWIHYAENFETILRSNASASSVQSSGIHLMTYHASKGLEFDSVHLIDVIEKIIPSQKAVSPEEIEEERRCFYVALTRARTSLHIYFTDTRYSKECSPSRFILEGYYGQVKDSRCRR